MRHPTWASLVACVVLIGAVAACGVYDGPAPSTMRQTGHSEIVTGPGGLRTFTWFTSVNGVAVACDAVGLLEPVHGTLNGAVAQPEPVWLETPDGRHLSVVWPAGFTVRFEPAAALYSDKGQRIAVKGDDVVLSQTRWDSAAGSFDDPYIAQGLVFNGCYPFLK